MYLMRLQATVEREAMESTSQKTQLDSECSQLRLQIKGLKETLVKETETWETDRTTLSRQLELVHFIQSHCSCIFYNRAGSSFSEAPETSGEDPFHLNSSVPSLPPFFFLRSLSPFFPALLPLPLPRSCFLKSS